jgi:hypothetical protein
MHLHLVRATPHLKPVQRPAKVVQLEARRQARLAALAEQARPRPAA